MILFITFALGILVTHLVFVFTKIDNELDDEDKRSDKKENIGDLFQ